MRQAFHPSRRALIVLVSTVLVVSFVMVWTLVSRAQGGGAQEEAAVGPLAAISVSRDPSLARQEDSDQDGLFDWEESLRGSDPKNADSDGDGTEDGDEVAQSRDPLTAGPNDDVSALAASSSAALGAEYGALRQPGSVTDDFAERFAQSFVSAQASGGAGQSTQDALVASLSSQISGAGSAPDRYRAASVPTDPGISLQVYADWLANTQGDAVKAMGAAKGRADYPSFVGQAFVNLGRTLCASAVPPSVAAMEAEICNVNDHLGEGILSFASGEADPLRAILGIATLRAAEERRSIAYLALAQHLYAGGVHLGSSRYPGFWAAASQ